MTHANDLRKATGANDRSSEHTAYDASKYAHIIDWTHTSLLIFGRPVQLISAEFQYFRVPDRERWRPLLADIKAIGFNCVRLYIHWGYHCPAEGVYNFRANRDIDYLLSLCVELELFVIAAPGPYICAEVQAGGFPIWCIAKREMRIRHLTCAPVGMFKRWDQRWHQICADYMRKVMPMLVKWERTSNPNGCIIALQVENELREPPMIGVGGVDDEIRLLCNLARECGSTVPFFHNDDSPIGSWSAGGDYRSLSRLGGKTGVKAYRTDLYGFDLYFTFPPGDRSGDLSSLQLGMLEACGASACLNCCGVGGTGVGGSDTPCISCLYDHGRKHAPPPALAWADANQMEKAIDVLGDKLFKFGGSSRFGPPIVAEAQVGWINQWGRMRNYDDVYNFFGPDFSAALQNSLMAQGVTVVNHYAAYGGTNHGTVGDTEVYSSYDYSAFIREYGMLSGRGRVLRQSALFSRSFSDIGFSNSVRSSRCAPVVSAAMAAVKATVPSALLGVREAVPLDHLPVISQPRSQQLRNYAFLRNLKHDVLRFSLIVDNVVLPCRLKKCESFVAPLYHELDRCDLSIFACTIPVLCRASYQGSELWILRVRKDEVGRMIMRCDEGHNNGRRGVTVKWANLNEDRANGSVVDAGELTATDADDGAATSMYSAPLEELPLRDQDAVPLNNTPIGVRTSTEDVGVCFSFSFSVKEACVAAVYDLSEGNSAVPVLRLLCLTEEECATFSADLPGNDVFKPDAVKQFTAAWGVTNIAFLPGRILDVGCTEKDDGGKIFALRDGDDDFVPEQFERGRPEALAIMPGLCKHHVGESALTTAIRQGVETGDPLSKDFEFETGDWSARKIDWTDDVVWKPISYNNRDPLDHLMTSGHVAYRVRFRTAATTGSIIVNVRHAAVLWCNGITAGGQVCFSHNMMSAGAMHAIDLHHSGKKRHDISNGLRAGPDGDGVHEIVILVLSMGQSRSPFLLNDVRNKRGLLSARLSRRMGVKDVRWEIAGVDVTRTDDAFGSSGLPAEDEANTLAFDHGFANVETEPGIPGLPVKADDGLIYYRTTFRVPPSSIVGGYVRYPIRIKVESGAGVRAMIWVNTLFLGRYVEPLGPQTDFYVPEGLIKQCKGNSLVLGVYGPVDSNIRVRLLPWVVNPSSGNIDEENGIVYALHNSSFNMSSEKGAKPLTIPS